jgi:hypothetical protein
MEFSRSISMEAAEGRYVLLKRRVGSPPTGNRRRGHGCGSGDAGKRTWAPDGGGCTGGARALSGGRGTGDEQVTGRRRESRP